jgi:FtsP/CotA-like multicopper oxidase with cupredoxin domain
MNKKWILISFIILGITIIIIGIIGLNINSNQKVVSDNKEARMLPIPALLEDENEDSNIADFNLVVQQGETNFYDDVLTPTLGYNGSFLGPVIKVRRGETVNMHVQNDLVNSTTVHWHGLEVNGTVDGGPYQVINQGALWEPSFIIDQQASTLWFHPHVIGTTAIQVYYGLAGLIIVEDEFSDELNIPKDYGVNDIPLIIQDRSFNSDGTFSYARNMMDGVVGDNILVNGAITPTLIVDQTNMRFRILNGANASNFNLELSDQTEFYQIASDGGFLEKPYVNNSLFISPGERAEIIIDFSKYTEGEVVNLQSGNKLIMTFVIGEKSEDMTEIPDTLVNITAIEASQATSIKTIELDGMGHMVSLNGKKFDMNRIDDRVELGAIEIWEITTNSTMMGKMGHPFHIHGTQFQVLSRNGEEPEDNEKGFKDTVFVGPDETVRIVVQFKNKGIFMYHCHILEHEEAGMMGQLEVK